MLIPPLQDNLKMKKKKANSKIKHQENPKNGNLSFQVNTSSEIKRNLEAF